MLSIMYKNKRILYVTPNDILTFDCSQQQVKNQRGVDFIATVMKAGRFPRFEKKGGVLEDFIECLNNQRVTVVTATNLMRYLKKLSKKIMQQNKSKIIQS